MTLSQKLLLVFTTAAFLFIPGAAKGAGELIGNTPLPQQVPYLNPRG